MTEQERRLELFQGLAERLRTARQQAGSATRAAEPVSTSGPGLDGPSPALPAARSRATTLFPRPAPPASAEQRAAWLDLVRAAQPELTGTLAALDPHQQTAVCHPGRALLVRAQVGSGKTTVLLNRALRLHLVEGVPFEQLALLTFTNQAAGELRTRLQELRLRQGRPPLPAQAFWLTGTFHAVARNLLMRVLPVELLGFRSDFRILDEGGREELWDELIATHRLRIKYRRQLAARREALTRGATGRMGRMVRDDELPRLVALEQEAKRARNLMDFDDLLDQASALLARLAPTWPLHTILVDELQDCDLRQLEFVRRLAQPATAVFAVGDPNQVIYTWRGSRPRVFEEFRDQHGCEELTLPMSYRSTATILAGARALLGPGPAGTLAGVRGPGGLIRVRRHLDPFQEACYLVHRLAELHDRGVAWRAMALLFRTRRQAEPFHAEFCRRALPHEVGARPHLRDRPGPWWITRLLRTCLTPWVPELLRATLADPRFGVLTPGELARASGSLRPELHRVAPARPDELLEPGAAEQAVAEEPGGATRWLETLAGRLRTLLPDEARARQAAGFCLRLAGLAVWLDEVGPLDLAGLQQRLELRRILCPTAASHAEDVAQVEQLLAELIEEDPPEPECTRADQLREALERVVLGCPPRLVGGIHPEQDSVKLLTLHAAKGLEFEHVFVSGVNAGLIPLVRGRNTREEEAEERRLFFVGLTRAREGLELSYHLRPDGPGALPEPSPLLHLLPRELLQWEQERPGEPAAFAQPPSPARVEPAPTTLGQPEAPADVPSRPGPDAWHPGQLVTHPRYGPGELVAVEAGTIRCRFPGFGERAFSATLCPLRPWKPE